MSVAQCLTLNDEGFIITTRYSMFSKNLPDLGFPNLRVTDNACPTYRQVMVNNANLIICREGFNKDLCIQYACVTL